MITYFRGSVKLKISGAAQQLCLNRFAREKLPFWGLEQESELCMSCLVYRKDAPRAMEMAKRAQCEAEAVEVYGIRKTFSGLKRRPVLVVGLVLVVAALLLLPQFVWVVRVEGNESIQTELLLRELSELDVRFGAWGPGLDSPRLRDQLMNRIPELRWCAVNRNGGWVTVLVAERELTPPEEDTRVTNVVAARAGIIQEMNVLNGFRACRVGEAVTEGQLLVSGLATWPMGTQAVHAEAEIYALTRRQIEVKTPLEVMRKRYTGEEVTRYSLIAGRKRINLSGNSGILHGKCDKIVERKQLTLPEEITFPLILEVEHIRGYELEPEPLDQTAAMERLSQCAAQWVERDMVAGTIQAAHHSIRSEGGCWIVTADHSCREMIARTVPAPIFGGSEQP